MDMGHEEEGGVSDVSQIFDLNIWVHELAIIP